MKHTTGPWEACDQGDYGDFDGNSRIILGDDMRIAVVQWSPGDMQAESDANACLIAAAPDLLAALVEILGPLNVCSDNKNVPDDTCLPIDMTMGELRKARAAIAKATGAA
ncbi:hypothetical protein [Sphingobium baderi]|nr:hypothetical protein [Sphingobium baderi]